MSVAKVFSAQLIGLESSIVTIEVDISNGLHAFNVVGLGDRSVTEAKDRISAAIKNTGYISPKQKNQKVVISLAPADVRKEGPSFDLAMAIAYLCATRDIEFDPERMLVIGELSLEGDIRKVHGVLPILCQAPAQGFTCAFVPEDNAREASLARNIAVYPVRSLRQMIDHIMRVHHIEVLLERGPEGAGAHNDEHDLALIRGNEIAKRALEIAAAGGHNIMLSGPPGTGKSMLARAFTSLLPPLTYEQAVEVTSIHSAARALGAELVARAPLRAPHHTASYAAMVGGGAFPKPGEITLAHRGVLFLDEFPEFSQEVLEALRQPLEEKQITISRAKGVVTFPAQCILVASMNPCPCGRGGAGGCRCSEREIALYQRKLSGPIIDRFDIWVNVEKIDYEKLSFKHMASEKSAAVRSRIQSARTIQANRLAKASTKKYVNAEMSAKDIEQCVDLTDSARVVLRNSASAFGLSARAFHRIIKVAQTIADLAGIRVVDEPQILEALQFRRKI